MATAPITRQKRRELTSATTGESAMPDGDTVTERVESRQGKSTMTMDDSSSDDDASLAEKNKDLRDKLELDMWVQCENADCLKWRRLPKEESSAMRTNEPWFCSMAKYGTGSCAVVEEDHKWYDKLADRCRIKYVMSAMPAGTLVWARVAGFCRWPGVLCADPLSGDYSAEDTYGHTTGYHVEFLGACPSHCWVGSRAVEPYGTATMRPQAELEKGQLARKKKGKKKKKSTAVRHRSVRKRYQGSDVSAAIEEATILLRSSLLDRLKRCYFKEKPSKEEDGVRLFPSGTDTRRSSKATNSDRPRAKPPARQGTMKQTARNRIISRRPSKAIQKNAGTSVVKCRRQKTDKISGASSQSREEKYIDDIQSFQRNEAAFEAGLNEFLQRQGAVYVHAPLWNGITVTHLKMFLAVNERGGYLTVCEQDEWSDVYEELTAGMGGENHLALKEYYQRQVNLLPYELQLKHDPMERKRCEGRSSPVCVPENVHSKKRARFIAPKVKTETDGYIDSVTVAGVHGLLEQFDSLAEQCSFTYKDHQQQREWERQNVVTFYDERPSSNMNRDYRLADTASEFEPCLPEDSSKMAATRTDVSDVPIVEMADATLFREIKAMQAVMHDLESLSDD